MLRILTHKLVVFILVTDWLRDATNKITGEEFVTMIWGIVLIGCILNEISEEDFRISLTSLILGGV